MQISFIDFFIKNFVLQSMSYYQVINMRLN
jgi:hypothetical protein